MYRRATPLNPDRALHAYALGVALGDGNLSNPNGRATRLRITCDAQYPKLARRIVRALQTLLPQNQVSIVARTETYFDISVFSNHLEPLLGWRAPGGSKQRQNVCVPPWIFTAQQYITPCLRGLIETDGTIYNDRGYTMVMFSTTISRLGRQVYRMMQELGFSPHIYKVPQRPPGCTFKYQVRLSRDTKKFLDIVNPLKA